MPAARWSDGRAGRAGAGASGGAIVLGAVAATPYRARDAEHVVTGNLLTDEVIHEAARAAVRGAEPLALNEYKVALVQKLVTEALQELRA